MSNKKSNPLVQEKLGAARLYALDKMPYMASMMYLMVPVEMEKLGTLGVSEDARLFYDPELMLEMDTPQMATILLHEAMHLMSNHAERARTIDAFGSRIFNIAADCAINEQLCEAQLDLPQFRHQDENGNWIKEASICLPQKFNLTPGNTSEGYYFELLKNAVEVPMICCGSGAGNPLPDEGPSDSKDGQSKGNIDRAIRVTASAIQDHQREKGDVPAGLLREAQEILKPPKVPWQNYFRGKCKKVVAQVKGMIDFSYRRPSRRASISKDVIFPAMVAPIPTVGVLIDTSGSMSEEDLGLGLSEIRHVLGTVKSRVYLAVVDAALHSFKKVSSIQEIKAVLNGGGGTDLRPGFVELEKNHCDMIIAISDCEATFPEKPPRAKTVWLRVGGRSAEPPFGDVVDLTKD